MSAEFHGRQKNDTKWRMNIRDSENPLMYTPTDYTGNKFFGTFNKGLLMKHHLFSETREKYELTYGAEIKAEFELETAPQCYRYCVQDYSTGLNSREKNCMRDCYFKKTSSCDDFVMLLQQKLAVDNVKAMKERLV